MSRYNNDKRNKPFLFKTGKTKMPRVGPNLLHDVLFFMKQHHLALSFEFIYYAILDTISNQISPWSCHCIGVEAIHIHFRSYLLNAL